MLEQNPSKNSSSVKLTLDWRTDSLPKATEKHSKDCTTIAVLSDCEDYFEIKTIYPEFYIEGGYQWVFNGRPIKPKDIVMWSFIKCTTNQ